MATTHRVTLIPGDGTGPEISEATRRVLEGTGVKFDWDVQDAGVDVMDKFGTPLPDQVLDSIRDTNVAIKGPITTPVGTGFRSVNVALRKELDLYMCLRPCKSYPGVRSRYENIDLVIVRENHEDLYAGIEFEQGSPEAAKLIDFMADLGCPTYPRGLWYLDQAHLDHRYAAHRARRIRLRREERSEESNGGA